MAFDPSYDKSSPYPPKKYLSKLRLTSFLNSESENMDVLVRIANKLQDVLLMMGKDSFEFPQIVAVGDQSSGKSSVLEGIVGKSFLPRGTGAVTRRPLLLHLECLSKKKGRFDEESYLDHVVFQHDPKVFTDFKEVMKEIEEETERIAGSNKGICSEPIIMTLFSKHATSNLTLIDLPGLIKVPMGDQPADIEIMIKNLIISYISNPNSIILAVVTANTDIATSESLKMAREVDREGERTLAVVTKLDIMDAGTDAVDILTGKIIAVKLGVVGVVNRSQRDIMQGKTMKEAGIEEMNFFYKNYPHIAHKQGTAYLAKCLQKLLIEYIRKYLPRVRAKIQSALAHHTNILRVFNGPSGTSNQSVLQILTSFSTAYCSRIQGTSSELQTKELGGGARISYIFHEVLGSALNSINPLEGYSRASIMTAVRNSAGAKPCLFVPESCFELLVKKQIIRLEAPALRCVQLVYDEMERILLTCTTEASFDLIRYPKLSQRIQEVAINLLKSRIPETDTLVQKLIAIQTAYINTAHPDFKKIDYNNSNENQIVPFKEDDCPTVIFIEQLIISYFSIVKKIIQDSVPKAIMHCFVNYFMEHILSELVSNLYGPGKEEELLEESTTITEQKKHATRMINTLEKANSIISEINDEQFQISENKLVLSF